MLRTQCLYVYDVVWIIMMNKNKDLIFAIFQIGFHVLNASIMVNSLLL